jgi:hypothetical protein
MKQTAGWIAILIVLAVCLEIISFAVLTFVPQFQKFVYRTPVIAEEEFAAYMAERDPVLGWPSGSRLAEMADARGARLSPANAALGPDAAPCVSVYGDSFAYSDEAEDKDAWANVLADRLGCRVDNFGIGGYGADQAVLRLERHLNNGLALGDTLILTLYPDNLNRHQNQWRTLLSGGQAFSFKPAFHVDQTGTIALEPIFDGDYETFLKLTLDPRAYLPAERYEPGAPGFRRTQRADFPYMVPFLRIVSDQLRSFRGLGTSGRANFYNFPVYYDDRSGPSDEKKAVATHIVRHFAALCKAHDKVCAFVITPEPDTVLQRVENGEHDLRDWLEQAAEDLIFLDGTDMFTDLDDVCAHVTDPVACNGHYNAAGYARLAAFVDQGLKNAQSN